MHREGTPAGGVASDARRRRRSSVRSTADEWRAPAPAPGRPDGGDHDTPAAPVVVEPRSIAPGVLEIDTLLGGWERVTAGYLVEGSAPVLVETGSQSSVPVLLASLHKIGVGPQELAGVAITHIHLDHAGGVGDVARAFPVGHHLRAREGGPPPGRPDPPDRLGVTGLRAAAGLAVRSPRADGCRADSTSWPTARRSPSAPTGRWWRWTHQGTPSTMWGFTTRRPGSSSPGTPSGSSCPTGGCCARPPHHPTSI